MVSKRDKLTKRDILRHIKRIAALVIIVFALLIFIIIWKVFTVETVSVTGNSLYTDEEVQEAVLSDGFSWNSLFVYLKYRFRQPDNMPYASHVSVSLGDPHSLKIHVDERESVGYVYLEEEKQYGYLDKNGLVLRLVKKPLSETIRLTGIAFTGGALFEKVELENKTILSDLLRAVRLLKKYEIVPETIYVQNANAIYLVYGKIYVNIGSADLLNEKLVRLDSILPALQEEKMKGTLHLETWSENTTDIYFRKKEKISIPSDQEESSETGKSEKKKTEQDEKQDAESGDKEKTEEKA